MLCVQPPDLRTQPSRPRSDKARSIARDAFRVGREGFSVALNRLTLALAVEDLRTPRLSALRFGVFRLRAGVDGLRAKVAGLRAKGKPLRAEAGRWQVTNALEGYAVLKVTGKGQGVDDLRKMLATPSVVMPWTGTSWN